MGQRTSFAFKGHIICVWQFFFAKSLLDKGRWVKGRHLRLKDTSFAFKGYVICVLRFFFARTFFNKGGGCHLRLKDTSFAFGNFFLQNPFLIKEGGSKDVICV